MGLWLYRFTTKAGVTALERLNKCPKIILIFEWYSQNRLSSE